MSRTLRGLLFIGFLGSAVAVGGRVLAAESAPCKLATKGDSAVAKACTEGGVKKAKSVMKEMVKQAKAAGTKFECDDCHKDDTAYDLLTDDAKDKFKKLLAAVPKK